MGLRSYALCRLRIGYVPEEPGIFPNLTVRQNLSIGIEPNWRINQPCTIEKLYNHSPQLKKRDRPKARNVSGREQQMLGIARILMGNPELSLVDEPAEGLAPLLVDLVDNIV